MARWPGTSVAKSEGNAFDVRPGQRSIFLDGYSFRPTKSGKTQSQTATQAVERKERATGKSPGTVRGISIKADAAIHPRRGVKR